MKLVQWKDPKGYFHLSLLRKDDPDSNALRGLPQDPPDLSTIDWKAVMRDLHNELVVRRLVTLDDVTRSQNGLTAAILASLKQRMVALYRNAKTGG